MNATPANLEGNGERLYRFRFRFGLFTFDQVAPQVSQNR
jgi:hypothetical protein